MSNGEGVREERKARARWPEPRRRELNRQIMCADIGGLCVCRASRRLLEGVWGQCRQMKLSQQRNGSSAMNTRTIPIEKTSIRTQRSGATLRKDLLTSVDISAQVDESVDCPGVALSTSKVQRRATAAICRVDVAIRSYQEGN